MAEPDELRQELARAAARRTQLELAAAQAADALERVRRERGADTRAVAEAVRARDAADAAVTGQRTAQERLRGQLGEAIAGTLADRPEADFARLAATLPLVLLPVRIETRFRGAELLIRVYPDEIAGDGHEPELTGEERDLGFAYWRAVWLDPGAEAVEWRRMLASVLPARAAWVVART